MVLILCIKSCFLFSQKLFTKANKVDNFKANILTKRRILERGRIYQNDCTIII